MMQRLVTTYHLEMTDPSQLNRARLPADPCTVVRAEILTPELSRYFYTAVGGGWYWIMRLPWRYADWQALLSQPGFETWYGVHRGTPIGYFELLPHPDASVEIESFGLLPHFIGRGFGGQLLTAAIARAWQKGAQRVTVHTCTLDGPHALRNYLARGFRQVREEIIERTLPDAPPGPWPGAGAKTE
ncbi:MAG: GNAT family N-acetyltransferase [Caldilinea sp.]